MATKVCRKCNKEKALEDFYKGARYKDGYRSYCKECCDATTVRNQKKKSLENKPICKRESCSNRVPYHRSVTCSEECAHILRLEKSRAIGRKIYGTPEYRRKHRAYMRKYNKIDPKNYRIAE